MNEVINGIIIFVIGIMMTIFAIVLIQKTIWQRAAGTGTRRDAVVSADEFILETLHRLPGEPTAEQFDVLFHDLQKRYHLTPGQADEKLITVIRSRSFERVTGARCTCYASSKQYGKYFHSPDCEYRSFLENNGS